MRGLFFILIFEVIITSALVSYDAHAITYEVKKGDTLSEISYRFVGKNVYGVNGSLNKLLLLNPQIKNEDLIFPKQKIEIASTLSEDREQAVNRVIASIEAPIPFNENNALSSFGIFPLIGYSELNNEQEAGGARANALSDMGYGVNFDWTQHWSKKMDSILWGEYLNNSFNVSSNKTLSDKSKLNSEFGIGLSYHFSDLFSIHTGIGYSTKFFLRARSATEMAIEDFHGSFFMANPEVTIIKRKPLKMSLKLLLRYNSKASGADFDSDDSFEYGAGVKLTHILKWGNIEGSVNYSTIDCSYSSVTTVEEKLNMKLGVRFNISGGK